MEANSTESIVRKACSCVPHTTVSSQPSVALHGSFFPILTFPCEGPRWAAIALNRMSKKEVEAQPTSELRDPSDQ